MRDDPALSSEFDDISIGGKDANHRKIIDVYANERHRYAVYQTRDRVIVLYAEDPLVQRAQRKRLAKLATVRSQVDGDLADWRSRDPRLSRLPKAARQFDLRVGSALIEALEGDADTGLAILEHIRADIDGEKASRARLSYLLWTFATCAAFILACLLIYHNVDGIEAFSPADARSILHAMIAGVLGAFYSIAMGISRREIRNDQRRLDHVTDALVRISIGVLAACILETFLLTGTIRIGFANGADMAGGAVNASGVHSTRWPLELIAGFLAGFAERLVPDLLNSYAIKRGEPEPAKPIPPASPAKPVAGAAAAPTATGAVDPGQPAQDDAEAPVAPSQDDDVDGCVIGHADDAEATPDDLLPAASGGVDRE